MLDYKQFSLEAVKGRLGNFLKTVSYTISTLIKIHFKRITVTSMAEYNCPNTTFVPFVKALMTYAA